MRQNPPWCQKQNSEILVAQWRFLISKVTDLVSADLHCNFYISCYMPLSSYVCNLSTRQNPSRCQKLLVAQLHLLISKVTDLYSADFHCNFDINRIFLKPLPITSPLILHHLQKVIDLDEFTKFAICHLAICHLSQPYTIFTFHHHSSWHYQVSSKVTDLLSGELSF